MGVHSARIDDNGALHVDWYNFGEDVAYEYVSRMTFDPAGQRALAAALGAAGGTADDLLDALAARLHFVFEVEAFAKLHGIAFTRSTDFSP